jgi:hypothetical protein
VSAVTDRTDTPEAVPPDVDVEWSTRRSGPTPIAVAEPSRSRSAPTVDRPLRATGRVERIDRDRDRDRDRDSVEPVEVSAHDDADRTGTPTTTGTGPWPTRPHGDDGTDGRPADREPTARTAAPVAVAAVADRRPPRRDPAPSDRDEPVPV